MSDRPDAEAKQPPPASSESTPPAGPAGYNSHDIISAGNARHISPNTVVNQLQQAINAPRPPHVPERCFTWCSQRDGGVSMCRMLCFRRRQPLPTREEQRARLASPPPPPARVNGVWTDIHTNTTHVDVSLPIPPSGPPAPDGFFARMRHYLAPYSIVYVKGTSDGVAGRYMEELEGDDGQYDFGALSRHAPPSLRKQSNEGSFEYLEWGHNGHLVHIPLTWLLSPIINLPKNVETVMGPPRRLADMYISSFSNGSQRAMLDRLVENVNNGGAFKLSQQMVTYIGDRRAKALEIARQRQEANDAAMADPTTTANPGTNRKPTSPPVKSDQDKE